MIGLELVSYFKLDFELGWVQTFVMFGGVGDFVVVLSSLMYRSRWRAFWLYSGRMSMRYL